MLENSSFPTALLTFIFSPAGKPVPEPAPRIELLGVGTGGKSGGRELRQV